MYPVCVDATQEPLDLLLIQRMEAGKLDGAPTLPVFLVPHRDRRIEGVRRFDASPLGGPSTTTSHVRHPQRHSCQHGQCEADDPDTHMHLRL